MQAKMLLRDRKVEQTRDGMTRLRKQLEVLENEIDQIKMPIIEVFKDTIMKQRANAFRRSVKGSVDRTINEEILLPKL